MESLKQIFELKVPKTFPLAVTCLQRVSQTFTIQDVSQKNIYLILLNLIFFFIGITSASCDQHVGRHQLRFTRFILVGRNDSNTHPPNPLDFFKSQNHFIKHPPSKFSATNMFLVV